MAVLTIIGIDLAWGERRPDGLAWLEVQGQQSVLHETCLSHGDAALLKWIQARASMPEVFLAIDAPVICPNATGARPVDVLSHHYFRRQKCGCHPSNRRLCARPLRVAQQLQAVGYMPGWLGADRLLCEVYPHPATVRWFGLKERIPYKRGKVAERRQHFAQLQMHLHHFMQQQLPELALANAVSTLLQTAWSKDVEDQTDAVLAALMGYWHWKHQGQRSEVLGDLASGFILVPSAG